MVFGFLSESALNHITYTNIAFRCHAICLCYLFAQLTSIIPIYVHIRVQHKNPYSPNCMFCGTVIKRNSKSKNLANRRRHSCTPCARFHRIVHRGITTNGICIHINMYSKETKCDRRKKRNTNHYYRTKLKYIMQCLTDRSGSYAIEKDILAFVRIHNDGQASKWLCLDIEDTYCWRYRCVLYLLLMLEFVCAFFLLYFLSFNSIPFYFTWSLTTVNIVLLLLMLLLFAISLV